MRNTFLYIAFLFLITFPAAAQVRPGYDPDRTMNTIRAEYGALIPVGTIPNRSAGLFTLSYTRYYSGHWGWRGGIQYASLNAPADSYAGLPLAVVYRFSTKSFDGRLQKAMDDSLDDLSWNGGGDVPEYERQRMRNAVVDNILNIFLRRTEFYAGITPGYLFGSQPDKMKTYSMADSSGASGKVQAGLLLDNRFTFAADAGITLSIPIRRFSLDITPAAHYLFTDNVSERRQVLDSKNGAPVGEPTVKPIHWLFTLSGGLTFLF